MCTPTQKNYCVNEGTKLAFIIIWIMGNIAVFVERYLHYALSQPGSTERQFFDIMGHTLPLARACAAAIKLNSALILIFVLRNFLSWLRGTWVGTYFPVDKNIVFHKYIGGAIAFFTAIHILSHWINFYRVSITDVNNLPVGVRVTAPDGQQSSPTVGRLAFQGIAGGTGHAATFLLIFMYTTAVYSVRGPMFELFWFLHHLFVGFYVLISVHGLGQLLEPATFWMWVIGPIGLYLIERTVRILRSKQNCIILQAYQHPSRVMELRMKKSTFNYIPGQYVFLQCPYIANFEWHPFTISSSPDEDFLSVHIRRAGDWTGSLHDLLNPGGKEGLAQEYMVNAPNGSPIIQVDGPFGAASEDVFKFDYIHLWAAGIGVTPFASILKAIKYKIELGGCNIQSVEFYWTNRDKRSFEWFLTLLAALEKSCSFLVINLYFTGKLSDKDKTTNADGTDGLTGLETKTQYGRPDIPTIYANKAQEMQGKKVGVFFCGPRPVSKALHEACMKNTNTATKTRFVYHKENF